MATKGTDGTDVGTTLTTQGDILYRDGSGLQRLGAGTSGQFLKTQGTGANPVWANLASNVDIVNYTAFNNTGVNSMSVTTDWSSNNYWKFEIFGQYQMNAAQGSKFRLRNSSGDITSQTYSHVGYYSHATEAHNSDTLALHRDLNGGLDNVSINGWGFNASRINPNFTIHLYKPDLMEDNHCTDNITTMILLVRLITLIILITIGLQILQLKLDLQLLEIIVQTL